MKLGIVGLGRMGNAIAQRAMRGGHSVFGFDTNTHAREQAEKDGVAIVEQLSDLPQYAHILWLMVPAGDAVDSVIAALKPQLKNGAIIIDGGNSFYKNSKRRAYEAQQLGVHYLDCGTSGGVHGLNDGFCLMVGGDAHTYNTVLPLFESIASPGGVAHVGPSGAGHYVKMVHNGIEYGLLQAYAEGFHLLKDGTYKDQLDLHQIAELWNTSAVIRSFLLKLCITIFKDDQEFANVVGKIDEGGTGKWTVENAQQEHIPLEVIEASLQVRKKSRDTGGNYATKLVALLREQFGGHAVQRKQ